MNRPYRITKSQMSKGNRCFAGVEPSCVHLYGKQLYHPSSSSSVEGRSPPFERELDHQTPMVGCSSHSFEKERHRRSCVSKRILSRGQSKNNEQMKQMLGLSMKKQADPSLLAGYQSGFHAWSNSSSSSQEMRLDFNRIRSIDLCENKNLGISMMGFPRVTTAKLPFLASCQSGLGAYTRLRNTMSRPFATLSILRASTDRLSSSTDPHVTKCSSNESSRTQNSSYPLQSDTASIPSSSTANHGSSSISPTKSSANASLTHTDEDGRARMVDVSHKAPTKRSASASGRVMVGSHVTDLIAANLIKKGDVMTVAQIAGRGMYVILFFYY